LLPGDLSAPHRLFELPALYARGVHALSHLRPLLWRERLHALFRGLAPRGVGGRLRLSQSRGTLRPEHRSRNQECCCDGDGSLEG
jgi:hypothetical protein